MRDEEASIPVPPLDRKKREKSSDPVPPEPTRKPRTKEEIAAFEAFDICGEAAALLRLLRVSMSPALAARPMAYFKIKMGNEPLSHVILDKATGEVLLSKRIEHADYAEVGDMAKLFDFLAQAPEIVNKLLDMIDKLAWQREERIIKLGQLTTQIAGLKTEIQHLELEARKE